MKVVRSALVCLAIGLFAVLFFDPFMSALGGLLTFGHAKHVVLQYPARLRAELHQKGFRYLSYGEIPVCARQGIVSVEDKRFYSNSGIDLLAIFRVMAMSLVNDHTDHGGSTLTQQLARIIIREPRDEPSLLAEARGLIKILRYALVVNHEFTKPQVMTLYLNSVYFGKRAQGIAQAARAYFHRDIGQLGLGQCVYLTGLPQAPSVFGREPSGQYAMQRYRHVLWTMVRNHYLRAKQARKLEWKALFARGASASRRPVRRVSAKDPEAVLLERAGRNRSRT